LTAHASLMPALASRNMVRLRSSRSVARAKISPAVMPRRVRAPPERRAARIDWGSICAFCASREPSAGPRKASAAKFF